MKRLSNLHCSVKIIRNRKHFQTYFIVVFQLENDLCEGKWARDRTGQGFEVGEVDEVVAAVLLRSCDQVPATVTHLGETKKRYRYNLSLVE